MIAVIVFSASVLGALGRALLPYLRKLKEAAEAGVEPEPFAKKYVFSAVFAGVVSTIVGILLFPTIIANAPTEALAGVFVYGFIAGWGATSLFNEVLATTTTTTKPEPTPTPTA
jgi:drug/metabolite transporter (DMT)-like permease